MDRSAPARSGDEYLAALGGWQHRLVKGLRKLVRSAGDLEETIKWGHLVYLKEGPVLLIRAEPGRVLFGFWRGKQLRHIEPRLKPSGKYDMATLELHEGDGVDAETVLSLVAEASAMNVKLGDPTRVNK